MRLFFCFWAKIYKKKGVVMKTTTVREFGKNMDEKETFYVEPKEKTK